MANLAVPARQHHIKELVRNTKQQENGNDLPKGPPLLLRIERIPLNGLFQRHNQIDTQSAVRRPVQSIVGQGLTSQLLLVRFPLAVRSRRRLHKPLRTIPPPPLEARAISPFPSPMNPRPAYTRQHASEDEQIPRRSGTKRAENNIPEHGRRGLDAHAKDNIHRVRITRGLAAEMGRRDPEVHVERDERPQRDDLDKGEKPHAPGAEACVAAFADEIEAQ